MTPIRVAVIGCGEISQLMHLRVIEELPDLELVALCDLSGQVLEALGSRYGVDDRYTSYEDLLAEARFDAVLVATPDHAGPAVAALTCGKHLLLEKPIAHTLPHAHAIADAARASGAVSMLGYMRAFDPAVEFMRDRLPGLGKLKLVRSHNFGNSFLPHADLFTTVRPAPAEALTDDAAGDAAGAETTRLLAEAVGDDAGVQRLYWSLLMGVTHDLSILRTLLGQANEVLYAYVDETRLIGGLAYGATICELEWETASTYAWWDQQTTVYGQSSVIEARFPDPYVPYASTSIVLKEAGDGVPVTSRVSVSNESPFRREWVHFAESIRAGTAARTTLESGVRDLELIHELVQSARR